MLFAYQYVSHDLEKMQGYMDFIFYEVWIKADILGEFDISLFDGNTELQTTFNYLYLSENSPEYGKKFVGSVKKIFDLCKLISRWQRRKLSYWYKVNNRIEDLCNGMYRPALYSDLDTINKELSKELKSIYGNLYSQNKIGLQKIRSHYTEFVMINNKGICPFCGLYPLDGEYSKTRDAYDHYLSQGQYPFTAINFKNLVPMCHKCNSGNKGVKSPIFDSSDNRREAFYPYMNSTDIKIEVNVSSSDIQNLQPADIDLTISATEQEKTDTWQDLFGIDSRYKELFCSTDGKVWIQQIIDEAPDFKMNSSEYLKIKKKQFEANPYSEKNFLKVPFLESCEENGMFNEVSSRKGRVLT